jgi:tetratricopeptide (TPR) repeat protein
MKNIIAAAKDKLDDPVIIEWAIYYYRDLPVHYQDEKNRIETEWFNEFFIAQMVERGETDVLTQLFWELPPEHFSNLKGIIIKNWPIWPTSLVCAAAQVLAAIAPEALLPLYDSDLTNCQRGKAVDLLRLASVDRLLDKGVDDALVNTLHQLSQLVIQRSNDFKTSMLINPLIRTSKLIPEEELKLLITAGLQTENSERRRIDAFKALFIGQFGHDEFLDMVIDRDDYVSPLRLTALQPFFDDSAPLAEFDNWLNTLPNFEIALKFLESLSEKSTGCRVLLGLLRDSREIAAKLSSKIKTQLAFAACLHGLTRAELAIDDFDLPTTVNLLAVDLLNPRWGKTLTEHLRCFDQQSVIAALTTRIEQDSNNYGAIHVAKAIGVLGWHDFVDSLITATADNQGDYLCEAASKSLRQIGSAAQAALIDQWDKLDRSQQIYGQYVIKSFNGPAAVAFAVARFSELLADDVESACELFVAAPDLQLLNLLKSEIRRKQPMIDRAYYISVRLLEHNDPDFQVVKDRVLAEYQRVKNVRANIDDGGFLDDNSLVIELECPQCMDVNRCEIKGVVSSDDKNPIYLVNDEFPCPSCGQDVEFKLAPMAFMALTAEFMKMTADADYHRRHDARIKFINCRVDGQVMPLATGLATIRNHLAENPNDAKQWLFLGNLLSHLNRPKATVSAFQNALNLEPNAIDVVYALAKTLSEQGFEAEAFEILQGALEDRSAWIFLSPSSNFPQLFADIYNHLRNVLKKHGLAALHPTALTLPKKPGRNDSCPCGSGKKYKKCCGR